ncbi:MAG: hypothetical protein J6O51_00965 [Bacteroidales bacterium]|nr:hypothetical protein [Bacteroidales bacterium]
MKYYINTLQYNISELKAADKHILPFLKPFIHIAVSRRWADGLGNWISAKLGDFYKTNPRASKVRVSCSFPDGEGYRSGTPYPTIQVGCITITLLPIKEVYDIFEIPMFPEPEE